MKLSALFAALWGLAPIASHAFSYPALDTTSHWTIQDYGFNPSQGFYVQGAGKNVWQAAGQPVNKSVFYNFAVLGATKDGGNRPMTGQDFLGEMQGEGYISRYGSFKVDANVSLIVVLFFFDDGKFEATAYFSGSGYSSQNRWDVLLRIDYDMAESGNNICEFLWNRASEGRAVSPPQYPRREASDGLLNFSTASGGPSYWAASTHEIGVSYPPLARESGQGIENAGFARILNASNPQFGMVLWGNSATPLAATFKAYTSFTGNPDPGADISMQLQYTGEFGAYPRYAYAGRDQLMFLRLKAPVSGGTYQFGGKLFQRNASRPLAVSVHQHPQDQLGGFNFDPDQVVRYTSQGGRTFRNALGELSGDEDLVINRSGQGGVPYLPFNGYAQPGQAITEAQLHNLMTANRDVSVTGRENVRERRADIYLVDWVLQGATDAWEAMFDYGGADANGIAREGAAVFWPALAGSGADFQQRQSLLSALRATGLTLNMDPSWGSCPFAGYCWNDASACGGKRCGASCPPQASGCRYQAYNCANECSDGSIMSLTDVNHSSVRFNGQAAPGSPYSELDWYQRAPEAWVKPGRFGVGSISGPLPAFTPN